MVYKARRQGHKGRYMRSDLDGRQPAKPKMALTLGLLAALGLGACTTTEGTNALSDFCTFEREVMTSTLQGLGMVEREEKEETNRRRAPLVIPRTASLPAPVEERDSVLPEDSDTAQLNTAGLTEADIRRLRNARVVDLRSLSGRPLTEAEARQLTARMTAARLKPGPRPLYLPPDEYFTVVGGRDTVCMARSGELVALDDEACPAEIRKALQSTTRRQPQQPGALGTGAGNLASDVGLD